MTWPYFYFMDGEASGEVVAGDPFQQCHLLEQRWLKSWQTGTPDREEPS